VGRCRSSLRRSHSALVPPPSALDPTGAKQGNQCKRGEDRDTLQRIVDHYLPVQPEGVGDSGGDELHLVDFHGPTVLVPSDIPFPIPPTPG
jgi:hypothetical protein